MSCVTCHVSHVMCHMSRVTCHVSHVIFFLLLFSDKVVEGLLSTGPTPSSFKMFSVIKSGIEHSNYWKPNTSVLLSTWWILQIFIRLGHFCCFVANFLLYFTIFFIGSDVCLERYDSYGNFGLKKNITNLILREFSKRAHGQDSPPISTAPHSVNPNKCLCHLKTIKGWSSINYWTLKWQEFVD